MRMRPDLEAIAPARVKRLPVDPDRGYPVPWFVHWIDGKPEFRIADSGKYRRAVTQRLCWVCGEGLGRHLGFVIGPMCSVNRVSSDPPAHRECAEFSLRACPFLTKPQMVRREEGLPDHRPIAGGTAFLHNPGLMVLWLSVSFTHVRVENGFLFRLGDPLELSFWREGRAATEAETVDGLAKGVETLRAVASADSLSACAKLEREVERLTTIVPPAIAAALLDRVNGPRPAA